MALPAVAGNTILAADLYQLCQPSGGQEKGKYYLLNQAYTINANAGNYIPSQSRNATPVSVSIDEADEGHVAGGCNPAVAQHLTANGFLVFSSGTGTTTAWQVGGNYTIQF